MLDGTQDGFDWVIESYDITHCPYLIYLAPNNTEATRISSRYQGEIMAYQGVKDWIIESAHGLILKEVD